MTGKYVIKQTDLPTEMKSEVADAIQTGIESYAAMPNVIEVPMGVTQLATKYIKELMDKRYGPTWQCIIGEGFAYDVTIQSGTFLFLLYNGMLGCLVFKT